MLRRTNFGMLVDDLGTSSEDEKALAELIKIAESVGMQIIENKTAISIKFCLEVIKKLVKSGTDARMNLLNHIERLEERIKHLEQEPCKETIKEDVWKFAIHCMELGYGVDILKQYTASEAMAKLEKFRKLEQIAPCDDVISRQWIKAAIHNFYDGLMHTPTEEDIQAYLSAAPSVQPKVVPIAEIRFDNDKLHEIVDAAVKNIEIKSEWTPVLDKIRAEIEQEYTRFRNRSDMWSERACGLGQALEIIDKYRAESEAMGNANSNN